MGKIRPAVEFAQEHFAEQGGIAIAEIGVQTGGHAEQMFNALNVRKMYLIDCWESIDRRDVGEDYRDGPRNYSLAVARFDGNLKVEIIKGRSQEVMPELRKDSFDFIYIDGDHFFEACRLDILNALRLVRVGGVVGGHDYGYNSGFPIDNGSVSVVGAVYDVFKGIHVYGRTGDWWVVVTKEMKRLTQSLKGERDG